MNKKKYSLKFISNVITITTSLIVLTIFLIGWIIFDFRQQRNYQENKLTALVQNLVSTIKPFLLTGNYYQIGLLVKNLTMNNEIISLEIESLNFPNNGIKIDGLHTNKSKLSQSKSLNLPLVVNYGSKDEVVGNVIVWYEEVNFIDHASEFIHNLSLQLFIIYLITSLAIYYSVQYSFKSFFKLIELLKNIKINFDEIDENQKVKIDTKNEAVELQIIANTFNEMISYILKIQNEKLKQKEVENLIQLSSRVSHDIRSPLSALNMLMGQISQIPETQRILMRSSIQRINDIANDLLQNRKQIKSKDLELEKSCTNGQKYLNKIELLSPLIDSIVSEKRIQFREKQDVYIEAEISQAYGLFANINSQELKRTISNLLNNSIEALPSSKGKVVVSIHKENEKVVIDITDNGKGIPEHILLKLGKEEGVSFDKDGTQSGSGLGVYHAKKIIEEFGGQFFIESKKGQGTTIKMTFNKMRAPQWFVEKLILKPSQHVISLDDDLSIHGIWKGRFSSKNLHEVGIKHFTFTSGEEFKEWFSNNKAENSKRLYLVDYELLNQKQTGLEIIEEMGIGPQSILVSSRYEEEKIREKCKQLGVLLIPKAMACFVPIGVEQPKEKYDCCLLDDDFLTRDVWKMALDANNKTMFYASNPEELLKNASVLDLEVPIYVDSNLGNEISGEEVAKKLFDMGFKNIWICTGYQASDFPPMPWVKGILGKEPPHSL